MGNSIITDDMEHCFICEGINPEWHHVIFGNTGRRTLADYYGLIAPLCAKHHRDHKHGVHFNKELDKYLKRIAQEKFKEHYPELNFQEIFGKNY